MTVNTPFEGFKCLEMPCGIISTSEIFQRVILYIFEGPRDPDIAINYFLILAVNDPE